MASSSGEDHGLLLGLTLSTTTHHITTAKPPNNNNSGVQTFEPSLSLALITPTDPVKNGADDIDQKQQYRGVSCTRGQEASPPNSAVSSFSAASGGGGRIVMKRERDVLSSTDEMETADRVRASDEEEDGGSTAAAARKKLRLTKEQSALLEESFKHHSTLNPKQKQGLARQLNLRARQVEVWFQNRRARTKLKQTEVDCELLKKCCETLTDENRRLHKELQELKGLKSSPQQPPQFYMQMPAASTLSMCPSCERIAAGSVASTTSTTVAAGGADHLRGGPNSSAFSMAQKPQFLNPFTNPSAAC